MEHVTSRQTPMVLHQEVMKHLGYTCLLELLGRKHADLKHSLKPRYSQMMKKVALLNKVINLHLVCRAMYIQ